MNAWNFQMRGQGTDVLEIDIYDVVGGDWFFGGITARDVRYQLKANATAKTIKLRINSEGGDVFEGFAIYNLLNEHSARVEVDVDGLAASIASVIMMAADEIRIAQNGWVMIHNAHGIAHGGADELRTWGDVLEKMNGQAADIYAARTGLSKSQLLEMMASTTWMTAKEAKKNGFVDSITPAKKGKQEAKASARAFASMRLEQHANVPDGLRAVVEQARAEHAALRSQQNLFPDAGGDSDEPHTEPTGQETSMSEITLKAFLETAGIASAADLNARLGMIAKLEAALGKSGDAALAEIDALRTRAALATKLEGVTGKTGEDAHGVLLAWKGSHEELPGVAAELATTRQEKSEGDLVAALEKAKTESRHTPAREEKVRKMIADKEVTAKGALSVVAEWGVISALAAARDGAQAAQTPSGEAQAALKHNGKTYAEMTPTERAALKRSDRALFDQMRAQNAN